MKTIPLVLIAIIFLATPYLAFSQSYIWEEDFNPPMDGWILQDNWTMQNGTMYFNWNPTITNYSLSATSPEFYLPADAGDLLVTQYATYFSYQNEAFEIAVLIGDQVNEVWTHTGPGNWGSFGGSTLALPLTPYSNQSIRLRFRSYGNSTYNTDGWTIYHVAIEGPTGDLNGYVYDQATENPLSGTVVEIIGTGASTTTNHSGFFSFVNFPAGTYDVGAVLIGYDPLIIEDVLIENNQTTNIDFYLFELDNVNVSGQIVGSDLPTVGIEGAEVSLSGYNDYSTVSGTNGYFTIPNVYTLQVYTITVVTDGYSTYTGEAAVGEVDLDLGAIIVDEIAFPPHNVMAELNPDNNSAFVNWDTPSGRMSPGSWQVFRSSLTGRKSEESRILEGYIIYRFLYDDLENEDNWTELSTITDNYYTDTGIPGLVNGTYCYAVRAVYTNNVISEPVFSNTIAYEEQIPDIANLQAILDGNNVHLIWEWANTEDRANSALECNLGKPDSPPLTKINKEIDSPLFVNRESTLRELLGFVVTRNGLVIAEGVPDTTFIDQELPAGDYHYTVIGVFTNGSTNMLITEINVPTSIDEHTEFHPFTTKLLGNHPNPFNPDTMIRYSVNQDSRITIEIFNIRGQLINLLVDDFHSAGDYSVVWDGKDEKGNTAASGIFFYRMKAGRYTSTRKMIMMK